MSLEHARAQAGTPAAQVAWRRATWLLATWLLASAYPAAAQSRGPQSREPQAATTGSGPPAAPKPGAGTLLRIAGREGLEPVMVPALEPFEPAVARQIAEAVNAAAAAIASPQADSAALAEAYGELGKLLHAYQLLDAARAAYRNAAHLAPKDAIWTYYLGHARRQDGDLDGAIEAWNRTLVTLGRGDSTLLSHLGRAHQARGDLEQAAKLLEQALVLEPGNAAAEASLGEIALARDDAPRAIVLLEAALQAVPAADRLYYPLAMAYRKAGQSEHARALLARRGRVGLKVADPRLDALEALKNGERVHLLRGRQAFAAGRFREAAAAFRQAAAADPSSGRARVNLGTALARMGDNQGAIAAFREALELEPRNATAHLNLGQLLLRRGDHEGLSHLESAVREGPADGVSHRVLADALRKAGRLEEALAAYHQAAVWKPDDEPAILGKAAVLVTLERYGEARAWLEEAHHRMPSAGRIAIALARLLAASPDLDQRDGARALRLAESIFAATHGAQDARLVALALAELGRCQEAASRLRQAIDALTPDDPQRYALDGPLARYAAGPPCRPPTGGSAAGAQQ